MEKIELFLSIIGVILVVVDVFLLRNSEKENKKLQRENKELKNIINRGV